MILDFTQAKYRRIGLGHDFHHIEKTLKSGLLLFGVFPFPSELHTLKAAKMKAIE